MGLYETISMICAITGIGLFFTGLLRIINEYVDYGFLTILMIIWGCISLLGLSIISIGWEIHKIL
jgi:hypothetical protein